MANRIMGHGVSGCFGTSLTPQRVSMTRGLGITPSSTSNNLTPKEPTNHDSPDMGRDRGSLSCPGSGVVQKTTLKKINLCRLRLFFLWV